MCGRRSLPALNAGKIWPKDNTPDSVTWRDTPERLLSTQIERWCTARISSDVRVLGINPQVLHNPLNTGVEGYAHTMHSLMNNGPLEYPPATFTVVPAQGDARAFRTEMMRAAQGPAEEPAK